MSPTQACPTGYRVLPDSNGTTGNSSLCVLCDDPAVLRDYFFLGFVCMVCIGVRMSVIATSTIGKSGWASKL